MAATASSMALFVGAALYISVLIFQRQDMLSHASRYTVSWSASQAASEMDRLETAVAEVASPTLGGDLDKVQLRYEIFLNRMELLTGGAFDAFVRKDSDRIAAVGRLRQAMAEVRPLLASVGRPETAARVLSILEPLNPVLLGLASEAHRVDGEQLAQDQAGLVYLHWQFTALVAGLILCGLGLIFVLLWNNRLLHVAHEALKAASDELRATSISRATLDTALTNMSQGLCMFDGDQRLVICNGRFRDIVGLRDADPSGMPFARMQLSAGGERAGHAGTQLLLRQRALIAGGEHASVCEELSDGRIIALSHAPLQDGGWLATYEDVTERKRTEAKMAHMARHDDLTGLPNRLMYRERLEHGLSRLAGGEKLAVICLDLDHFKAVNDTLGHPVGDELLRAVTDRLKACVRETDTVARLGGDEFAVVQASAQQPEGASSLARRVIDALTSPFLVMGHQVVVGTSLGISIAPEDGTDPDELLKQADLALYRAKSDGRSTFRLFEPEMDAQMQLRRALELDLRRAVAQKEFEIFYQPLVTTSDRQITGFEALLRWRHPERGLVPPDGFIPLAEEIGMITTIGAFVLRQACADAARWPGNLNVAVNLSPVQFRSGDLVATTADALAASGLPAQRLELEITETVLLQDTDAVLDTLHQLRALGVKISMDDFGTGYSSLSYLRKFPFDKIKVDRSFVQGLGENADSSAIVSAVMSLGASLGMRTTVEGVETAEQLRWLERQGCVEVQGYFFGRPAPIRQTEAMLCATALPGRSAAMQVALDLAGG